jgi:hypothetical protein
MDGMSLQSRQDWCECMTRKQGRRPAKPWPSISVVVLHFVFPPLCMYAFMRVLCMFSERKEEDFFFAWLTIVSSKRSDLFSQLVLIATRHELHGITSTSRQEICHRWIE